MAKLRADKRNYKKAFTVHANSYDNWNIGSPYSRRLLLCYCVECGLKCLIMENDNIYTISQADDETAKILGSHDEYYGAAEPPVRCGESHLSGLTEPPHFVY